MAQNPTSILIAVDGSEQSFEAVRYVGRLLAPEQTRITLFHVMNPFPETFWGLDPNLDFRYHFIDTAAWQFQQRKSIEEFMERCRRLLQSLEYTADSITLLINERDAGEVRDIARYAQQGYSAVVVGYRGISALKDLILGSTASNLLGHLRTIPLWVVEGRPNPDKILIAMDSSQGALRALEHVGTLFGRHHPELLLFHVGRGVSALQRRYEQLFQPEAGLDWVERAEEEFSRAAQEMQSFLEKSSRRLEKYGADPNRIHIKIVPGALSRAGAILEEAHQGGYGTIVLGRRGLSKVEEFILGRVSNKVLQLATETGVWVVP